MARAKAKGWLGLQQERTRMAQAAGAEQGRGGWPEPRKGWREAGWEGRDGGRLQAVMGGIGDWGGMWPLHHVGRYTVTSIVTSGIP